MNGIIAMVSQKSCITCNKIFRGILLRKWRIHNKHLLKFFLLILWIVHVKFYNIKIFLNCFNSYMKSGNNHVNIGFREELNYQNVHPHHPVKKMMFGVMTLLHPLKYRNWIQVWYFCNFSCSYLSLSIWTCCADFC